MINPFGILSNSLLMIKLKMGKVPNLFQNLLHVLISAPADEAGILVDLNGCSGCCSQPTRSFTYCKINLRSLWLGGRNNLLTAPDFVQLS